MINESMEGYLLGKMIDGFNQDLTDLFPNLEHDTIDYRDSGFKSRRRCFSTYSVENKNVVRNENLAGLFNHPKEFHKIQDENPIPQLESVTFNETIVETFIEELLPSLPIRDIENYVIGVNMIRVIADDQHMGSPAPGLHQDGYDYSCHLNVCRENVCGGSSLLATSQDSSSIVIDHPLDSGEFVFFNDRKMFHTATPVVPRIAGSACYRDMIIFDFVHNNTNAQ